MDWLIELHRTNPAAQAIAVLSLVCVVGMSVGSVTVRGVKLGTSAVLFAAIVAGHFLRPIDHATLDFVKELGLILFVFCMGLQLGPGFFASLRHGGLRLNSLAAAIVIMGGLCAATLGWLLEFDPTAVLGVYAGATTNTPSLGAAQQALSTLPDITPHEAALPALAYAVTYPLGVVGIMATMVVVRRRLRIDVSREVAEYAAALQGDVPSLTSRAILVENANLDGLSLNEIPGLVESGVVVSRLRPAGGTAVAAATRTTVLHVGDQIIAVGTSHGLDHFTRSVGRKTDATLILDSTDVRQRRVVITNPSALGSTIAELNLDLLHGVSVTRVVRGELEMTAVPGLRLKFGDILNIVGPEAGLGNAAAQLGDSIGALNETHFVPLFAGIVFGVLLGTLPLAIPGLPQPLRIGLAGGPLVVALVVGRFGRIGRLVWHMPRNANIAFREFGIALFFASVGLTAGPTFFAAVFSVTGVRCLLAGVVVTIVPLFVVVGFARRLWKTNFVVLTGLLAGSMTDPPALAFASGICKSELPAVTYATVYPLTMLLRIVVVQVLAMSLCQ